MSKSKFYSEAEHAEIADLCADKLIAYGEQVKYLSEAFAEIGYQLPLSCKTNYRDAMFHYKKVYERRDIIKVNQESYAMEEHLMRTIKDAISSYWQTYVDELSVIYERLQKHGYLINPEELTSQIKEIGDAYKGVFDTEFNWECKIKNELENEGLNEQSQEILLYLYSEKMDLEELQKDLQKCLHTIKNFIMRLRLNGTDIYRPDGENEYLRECIEILEKVTKCLEKHKIKTVRRSFAQYLLEYKKMSAC